MDNVQAFAELIDGKPRKHAPQAKTAMEGVVLAVTGDKATVRIDEYDPEKRFGPMSYGRTDTPPQVGDECLVVFVGGGIDRGWIVSWRASE